MATLEDELKDLKEKNNELAQKVQYWKMTAAQRDDEKLALMKEINELRLKLSRLRNNGGFQARKLDTALQAASEKAISHLVKASAEIAKSMEIAKAYMRDRQELDAQSPRWSSIGGTPTAEKSERVHRVPPMMMGGQSIQPVVALSRTIFNTSNPRTTARSPNQNRSLTERAVPMHMLQDVYIPLTRIDISDLPNNNMETDQQPNNANDSVEDLGLDDDGEGTDDSDGNISDNDDYDIHKLQAVSEEEIEVDEIPQNGEILPIRLRLHLDPRYDCIDSPRNSPQESQRHSQQDSQRLSQQENQQHSQQDSQRENPLEGPSWLLDTTPTEAKETTPKNRAKLEPDSTTELVGSTLKAPDTACQKIAENTEWAQGVGSPSAAFSPTLRRRKRTSSPAATPHHLRYSPRPASARRNSTSGRVLKVLVAKMRLDGSEGESSSPPKRARSPPQQALYGFDAPSPNGATDSRVIVSETRTYPLDREQSPESGTRITSRRECHDGQQRVRVNGQDSREARRSRLSHEQDSVRGRTTSEHDQWRINIRGGRNSHRRDRMASQETRDSIQRSRIDSHDSRDSDSGSGGAGDSICEGRTRRPRKAITYKEKPLNRKLRR